MFTAYDAETDKYIPVKPIAVYESDAFDTLLIADANTGKGMWFGYDTRWHIDLEDGDLTHSAERVEGVFGADEDEWEAAANEKLGYYGLKLGGFDEKAGGWELIEL